MQAARGTATIGSVGRSRRPCYADDRLRWRVATAVLSSDPTGMTAGRARRRRSRTGAGTTSVARAPAAGGQGISAILFMRDSAGQPGAAPGSPPIDAVGRKPAGSVG